MALELKILSPSEDGFVKNIIWNADEIAAAVAEKLSYYRGLVYTDDQIIDAKKDRAALNKFIAALKAKDREIKALCLQPYEEFHARMLQIIAQVEEPAALIDSQVKGYEEGQRAIKTDEIRKIFDAKGFLPWVTLDRIMNQKWLNKTCSLKQIEADLTAIRDGIEADLQLIGQMGDGKAAALREYQRTLSKTAAVEAGNRFIEAKQLEARLAAQKAEQAAAKQAEIDRDLGIVPEAPEPVTAAPAQNATPEAPEIKKISFSVWVTREQLGAINRCLKENRIRFEQIRKE